MASASWLREEIEKAKEDLQSWPAWKRKETGLDTALDRMLKESPRPTKANPVETKKRD